MTELGLPVPVNPARISKRMRLGRVALVVFLLVFFGVMAIGGASLLLVDRMMDKTQAIEQESRNVDFINQLQHKAYALLLDLHHMQLHGSGQFSAHATALADELERDIAGYLRRESESPYPEGAEEIGELTQMRGHVRELRDLIGELALPRTPPPDSMSEMDARLFRIGAQVQQNAERINRLHFAIIDRKIAKTRASENLISTIYLCFSLTGLGLIFIGYCLYSRHVAKPIFALVGAARRLAQGDLGTRVQIDSRTEIGQLYEVFNNMAMRLQDHEAQLVAMNHALEDKVRERTRELEMAQAELVRFEKMALLGQIASSVNHEIRTPLNALYLNVQMIRRVMEGCGKGVNIPSCVALRDDVQARLALIEGEVHRISEMLEEFVRYARLAPPRMMELEINQVVGRVAEMIEERARQAGVDLRLRLPEEPVYVCADEDKLIQALLNLCTNAFHAMPTGGILDLAVRREPQSLVISVSDSGTGIPEEALDKIFQPFFSSKTAGLGFGLSIVQRIVEDHKGRITCRSRVGEGTAFDIELPLQTPCPHGADHASIPPDRR